MNYFHRQRLLSGIRESHQVPIQADWAFAIRKQARLILVPLFREVVIDWFWMKWNQAPKISPLAENLYRRLIQTGDFPNESEISARKKVGTFLTKLTRSDKGILKFYFLSDEANIELLSQPIIESITDDPIPIEKIDKGVGKQLNAQFKDFSDEYLESHLLNELHEIENIISDSDLEIGLDTEAITRINESFSKYLDLPYGEISLIQKPIENWEFWEKVTAEEPETVGKKVNTDKGLEWVECWLLPNGQIRVKGDFLDEPDRNEAAIQALRRELPVILKAVHEQLIQHYDLLDSHIHYTFFTKRESLGNVVPEEGIQFFIDQIEAYGSDDFEPRINLEIRRYQNKTLQEWGTSISLGIEERYWLTEDEQYEFKV